MQQQTENTLVLKPSTQSSKQPKSLFLKFPGELLALIGDFLNEKLPLFIFTNKITFKMCLHYQIGYYEHQRQVMSAQVINIQRELEFLENTKIFQMSQGCRDEYDSLKDSDWEDLKEKCLINSKKEKEKSPKSQIGGLQFKQKDIIIMKLYLSFMG